MLFRKFILMTCLALALVVSPPVQAKKNQPALIEWGERITLTPPQGGLGRYPRLTKITRGARAGDLLICYQSGLKGGDFWLYRSSDLGRNWGKARKVNSATSQWNFASCNIIQLNDGRLMMSMLRRARGSNLSRDYYMDVRYSRDGGQSWSPRQQVFQGANWEGRAIQVPNDMNRDGNDDIYLFFTQRVIPTTVPVSRASRTKYQGRAVAWIASYDNGKTWTDPNPERFTGRIVHRNFDEAAGTNPADGTGGGMPVPFILNGNRIGFVAEQIAKKSFMRTSPYVVLGARGDWDWKNPAFKGAWTSVDYMGLSDNRVYPANPQLAWPVNTQEHGGAPYAAVLPNGRVAVAVNTRKRINVWVGNAKARNFIKQKKPFGRDVSFYAFIEPISNDELLVGAGPADKGQGFIYLRRGRILR